MDVLLRVIAILVEVLILASVMYILAAGVRLIVFDLGLGAKYNRVVVMVLIAAGCMTVVFFVAHLTSFYPTI